MALGLDSWFAAGGGWVIDAQGFDVDRAVSVIETRSASSVAFYRRTSRGSKAVLADAKNLADRLSLSLE